MAGDVTRPRILTDRPGLTEAALTDAYAAAAEAAQTAGTVTELAMREGVMALIVPVSYTPPPPDLPRPVPGMIRVPAFLDAAYARQTGEPFTGQQAPDGEDDVPVALAVQRYDDTPFPPVTIDVLTGGDVRTNIRIELTDAAAAQLAAALQAVSPLKGAPRVR